MKNFQVIHSAEQCQETLAFASEPVLASLANVLAYEEQKALSLAQSSTSSVGQQNQQQHQHQHQHNRQVYMKEYELLDMEIKYGLLQVNTQIYKIINTISTNYSTCNYQKIKFPDNRSTIISSL